MIEFTGYLTANALKYYQRRSIRLTRMFLALLFSMCVSGLFYANFWFRKQISAITAASAIVIFAVCIIFLPYPIFKWQKSNSLAKQIYIKDGMVFYVTDKGTVTQALEGGKGSARLRRVLRVDFSWLGKFFANYMRKRPFNKWHNRAVRRAV